MTEFDSQPTLLGHTLLLRPLREDDFDALFAAASDPLIWAQHPSPLRHQQAVFDAEIFRPGLKSGGALVVIDRALNKVIGSSRYYDIDPAQHELAIGYTFLDRSHWGGQTNGELKRLMLDHALGWAQKVWFHIGANNIRSRKAIEKIGAKLSHMATRAGNGVAMESAYYLIERDASASIRF